MKGTVITHISLSCLPRSHHTSVPFTMSPFAIKRPQQEPCTALEQVCLYCTWHLCALTLAGALLIQAGGGANKGVLTMVLASALGNSSDVLNKGTASKCSCSGQSSRDQQKACSMHHPDKNNASTTLCSHSLPCTFRQVILYILTFLIVKQG